MVFGPPGPTPSIRTHFYWTDTWGQGASEEDGCRQIDRFHGVQLWQLNPRSFPAAAAADSHLYKIWIWRLTGWSFCRLSLCWEHLFSISILLHFKCAEQHVWRLSGSPPPSERPHVGQRREGTTGPTGTTVYRGEHQVPNGLKKNKVPSVHLFTLNNKTAL